VRTVTTLIIGGLATAWLIAATGLLPSSFTLTRQVADRRHQHQP
jgi:hypothetical protein